VLISLGSGVDGHSGSHGGFVLLLLDEAMGLLAATEHSRAIFTVALDAKFHKGVPTPGVVLCRAWIEKPAQGRRMEMVASMLVRSLSTSKLCQRYEFLGGVIHVTRSNHSVTGD